MLNGRPDGDQELSAAFSFGTRPYFQAYRCCQVDFLYTGGSQLVLCYADVSSDCGNGAWLGLEEY